MTDPLFDGVARRHFRAILADPPWHFRSRTPPNKNAKSRRDVERHYSTMGPKEILALPVADYGHKDAHLFLWSTGPHLPLALETMAAWGFRYSGVAFTWIKLKRSFNPLQLRVLPTAEHDLHVGLGFTTRKNAEFCLLGRRGNAKRIARDVREIILAPVREHSRKPQETRERIERYCDGPYLELFAREARLGWTCRGNEVEKFGGLRG